MTAYELAQRIRENLPYTPNRQQEQLISALADYCSRSDLKDTIFILNGYAGTGKTSLTGALVNALAEFKIRSVLLAPTGRAAKVFGGYSNQPAHTIHRHIYRNDIISGRFGELKENKARQGTVFRVDESSMIDTSDNFSENFNLLDDLLQFVFTGNDCRLIFLGDTAQLPPVSDNPGEPLHKALKKRHFSVIRAILTNTVRQASGSGILYNATWLRRAMAEETLPLPRLFLTQFDDVDAVMGEDLAEEVEKSYNRYGIEDTIVITRTNKRAVEYNMAIRNLILERTSMLCVGDILMVAKNNYFWTTKTKGLDFIANGDMAVVEKIIAEEKFAGMSFATVELSFPDHDDVTVEALINITGLVSPATALTQEEMRKLAYACMDNPEIYPPGTPDSVRINGLRTDPYYNALQVKYGYAITCHKAQGGQWASVFVDIGPINEEAQGMEFYRWLYTATTRATEELHFINPTILSS